MSFKEGEIFCNGEYSWQIDHLLGIPAKIQTILYYKEELAGRWLYEPETSFEDIKNDMNEKIIEAKVVRNKKNNDT